MSEVTISKVDSATSIVDMAGLKKKDTTPYIAAFMRSHGVMLSEEDEKNLGYLPTGTAISIAIKIRESKAVQA